MCQVQVSFDVIVLEALGDDEEKDATMRTFMEARGFLFYYSQVCSLIVIRRASQRGENRMAHDLDTSKP